MFTKSMSEQCIDFFCYRSVEGVHGKTFKSDGGIQLMCQNLIGYLGANSDSLLILAQTVLQQQP